MRVKEKVFVYLGNYQGMRNKIEGRGRMQITLESLFKVLPFFDALDVLINDNSSSDGSWEYLKSLKFGKIIRTPRCETNPPWLATTVNNMEGIRSALSFCGKPYFWNIENDSFFYNSTFLDKSIELLESNRDISIVHLRHWTEIDSKNLPGVPRNLSRFEEMRRSPSGFDFYVLEKRPEYALWVPVKKEEIGKDFSPDTCSGLGKCPMHIKAIGAVRKDPDGNYERLLTEHWNSYTNHGWVARAEDLRYLFGKYAPIGERQLALAFKRHFKAAKLDTDAFVDFGWKFRAHPAAEEIKQLFNRVQSFPVSSMKIFGNFGLKYDSEDMPQMEGKLDVYS